MILRSLNLSLSWTWPRRPGGLASGLALGLVVGAVGLMGCAPAGANNTPGGAASRGPDITLPNIDGEDVRVVANNGEEIFVLAFWATWCQPCQSEMAKMDEMFVARRARGLRLYGVSIDGPDTAAQVPTWTRREGYRFDVLLDSETEVLGRFNPKGDIPFYVVLDSRGAVLTSHQGYNDGDVEELAEYLDSLLPSP